MIKVMFHLHISQFLGNVERQIIQSQQQSVAPFASSATKELDDLMASLSDFKVSKWIIH